MTVTNDEKNKIVNIVKNLNALKPNVDKFMSNLKINCMGLTVILSMIFSKGSKKSHRLIK